MCTKKSKQLVEKCPPVPLLQIGPKIFNTNCYLILLRMTVFSCHVTYAFQSKSRLCSCLNVKELLPQIRREIWSLSDCNCTRTHDHLVHERTLNHLAKLTNENCLLNCSQFGFLPKDSSVHQIKDIKHDVFTAFDTNPSLVARGTFLDSQRPSIEQDMKEFFLSSNVTGDFSTDR